MSMLLVHPEGFLKQNLIAIQKIQNPSTDGLFFAREKKLAVKSFPQSVSLPSVTDLGFGGLLLSFGEGQELFYSATTTSR